MPDQLVNFAFDERGILPPLRIDLRNIRQGKSMDLDDIIGVLVLSAAFLLWSAHTLIWPKSEDDHLFFVSPQRADGLDQLRKRPTSTATREINDRMTELDKDIIIFWGSQSGKSERLAKALARECQARYGIATMAADLDMFDFDQLATLTQGRIVGFVVASYGEGDPTDNANGFSEYLQQLNAVLKKQSGILAELQYFCFGLGDSRYPHYNRFVEVVDKELSCAGAKRVISIGRGDEASLSDDAWKTWKASTLETLSKLMGGERKTGKFSDVEVELELVNRPGDLFSQGAVSHVAEAQSGGSKVSRQPQIVLIRDSQQLSNDSPRHDLSSPSRTYFHIELSWKATGKLEYESGDHVAIWPISPDREVDLMASVFGWNSNVRKTVVDVRRREAMLGEEDQMIPITTPTTRDAILRYQMDICGALTREIVELMRDYAPSQPARSCMEAFLNDDQAWQTIGLSYMTCATLMRKVEPQIKWPEQLFCKLLTVMPKLRPRYFSIASSPLVSPNSMAITVGMIETQASQGERMFHGLTTSYLRALHEHRQQSSTSHALQGRAETTSLQHGRPQYDLMGPRSILAGGKLFANIRRSPFKLPSDSIVPIVMAAAGSGIAPFRAFVQERMNLFHKGQNVGKMFLFYGCRSLEDFLYSSLWIEAQESGLLGIRVAYSTQMRDGKRFYVQAAVSAESERVADVIVKQQGSFYICGSAEMAKGVKEALEIALWGCDSHLQASSLAELRERKRLQEDVWVS